MTDTKRSPAVPDLPTLDEAGLKGYELLGWNGLFFPRGTATPVIAKFYRETRQALLLPDIKERLAQMGAAGVGNTPEQFAAFIKAEIKKWAKVVAAAGLRAE